MQQPKVDISRPKKEKTGGRVKGVPNKFNADVKSMILGALAAAGGQKYLLAQAQANPVAFMGLIGKVLPTTLAGDPNAPLFPSRIEIKLVDVKR